MSTEQTPDEKTGIELISDAERQIGGIIHAVINENLPIEEADARIKLILEQTTPESPAAV